LPRPGDITAVARVNISRCDVATHHAHDRFTGLPLRQSEIILGAGDLVSRILWIVEFGLPELGSQTTNGTSSNSPSLRAKSISLPIQIIADHPP
jgi:hypothetical protein